jgi:hypothetical protein
MQICSCNCCGLGPVQSILLAALNCIWWLVASSILTAAAVSADAAGLPASDARHLILIAAWAAVAAELVHSLVACLVVGNNVCNILFCVDEGPGGQDCCDSCCGGCCAGCCHRPRRRRTVRQPLLPGPVAAGAAAAATSAVLHQSWWQRQQQGYGRQQQQQGPVTVVTVSQHGPGRQPGGSYMVSFAGSM